MTCASGREGQAPLCRPGEESEGEPYCFRLGPGLLRAGLIFPGCGRPTYIAPLFSLLDLIFIFFSGPFTFPPMYGHSYQSQPQQGYPSQDYQQQQQPSSTSTLSRVRDERPSHHHSNTRSIGDPLNFTSGQFSGQLIRAELIELQKADLGRKSVFIPCPRSPAQTFSPDSFRYARKDRRPLDPPPVVQLRLFKVQNAGQHDQREVEVENYDEISNMGLICHVDLFPVPAASEQAAEGSASDGKRRQETSSPSHASTMSTSLSPAPYTSPGQPYPYTFPAPQPPYQGAGMPPHGGPPMGVPMQLPPMHVHPPPPPPSPIFARSCTPTASRFSLVAPIPHVAPIAFVTPIPRVAPVVAPVAAPVAPVAGLGCRACPPRASHHRIVEMHRGARGDDDLAVKMEGNFILRYRCFDLFSKVSGNDPETPVWAQCYGGQFRVYSTKEFPGLRASTDLTKHLSYFGVRLNLRETERKRRKKVDDPALAGASSSRGSKGKRREDDESGPGAEGPSGASGGGGGGGGQQRRRGGVSGRQIRGLEEREGSFGGRSPHGGRLRSELDAWISLPSSYTTQHVAMNLFSVKLE
ncbi:hypothetical protein EW146_g7387 [Bondarzewia mesenterica]|uniref:Velvet domain-containing protein n=1 Tax=Bondarzewia mesenterica TaxID=1095465 RepID=A0A4S4LLG5_9AGAM|nr:hypothetical protein EW146_g7387 [Bondarzewia mesenterica]